MNVSVEDYKHQTQCAYKNENYSVRDNGAVLRYPVDSKRPRQTDNNWTFGKPNNKTGYLEIASVRIHRIVATAFHGVPPTKEHVVDHIDTNKQNNRPENLRWVTRLENILLNPITARRIELVCGSIEAFLADPSKFKDKFQEPKYKWMCAVTAQEAQESKERLLAWAKSDKQVKGGSIGEWIFNRSLRKIQTEKAVSEFSTSLTLNAVQQDWNTPTEFICCPQDNTNNPIADYSKNIKIGELFCVSQYAKSIAINFAISHDKNTLWVMCEFNEGGSTKPWSLLQVTYENELFVHTSLGTYFQKNGAEKQFILVQGLEWTGEDSIDDYC
ncbi:MAG: HNH endonuclease [Bacteroidetes bacterium]|nr:MAG: HNH endonuclease [Bacteroidota bacterium]